MQREIALHFRDQMRAARALALRDAEAFQEIVFVIERLGAYLLGRMGDMGKYRDVIVSLAAHSPMATDVPSKVSDSHSQFIMKYEIVREARNAALHEGALARHLTVNAVELSLVLEEAIMSRCYRVGDFMVRNPMCAYLWQPLSFIRQTMLVNSFSYLPVSTEEGEGRGTWQLISDVRLARYLRVDGEVSKERLIHKLQQAVGSGDLQLFSAQTCNPEDDIKTVLQVLEGLPALVLSPDNKRLVGILTPFDLL
jgi:CBS domain-containing protein